MDPRLGVPTMVLSMIAFLDIHVDTPGLFRQRVPPEAVSQSLSHYHNPSRPTHLLTV